MRHDANVAALRSVLEKNHLSCDELEKAITTKKGISARSRCANNLALSLQDAQKIVGVALSHCLMSAKDEDLPSLRVELKDLPADLANPKLESVIANGESDGNSFPKILLEKVNETQTVIPDTTTATVTTTTTTINDTGSVEPPREEKEKLPEVEKMGDKKERELESLKLTNKSLQYALQVLQDIEPPSKVFLMF